METSSMDRGFTQVPNVLLNNMARRKFTGIQLKLILTILRFTNGFRRANAELSLDFLAKEVGTSASVVSRQLTRLISIGVIRVCYINPRTKVRSLMVNNDVEKWGQGNMKVDNRECNTPSTYSPNQSNLDVFESIRGKVVLSEKIEKSVLKWLRYKNERREIYGKIPLITLLEIICDKARIWGEAAVIEVIEESVCAGYKNIVWEKLKRKRAVNGCRITQEFQEGYDHSALERLSRGMRDDK